MAAALALRFPFPPRAGSMEGSERGAAGDALLQRLLDGAEAGERRRLAAGGEGDGARLKFGLVPAELHGRLLDHDDYRQRAQAVEELRQVLADAPASALAAVPATALLGLVSFLYTLLDDANFKVVLGALQVSHLLAQRLGARVEALLGPLVAAAAKVLGDNKLAIRQEYRRLLLRLMKAAGPQRVLTLLLRPEHLCHKNSRVREEVLNVCIGALLAHPARDFDLPQLAAGLAPALVDGKRRVRHAALEAFAVLASAMGPGNAELLFKVVDSVELQEDGDGVMHAVQARLARKTLPKLTEQGFVEYAVPLPSSAHGRASHLPPGADTDWLLAGNRTQSAHSYCGDCVRREAVPNSGAHSVYADQGTCPRRVLSAGKGKNKLPWENEHASSGNKAPLVKGVEQVGALFAHLMRGVAVCFCEGPATSGHKKFKWMTLAVRCFYFTDEKTDLRKSSVLQKVKYSRWQTEEWAKLLCHAKKKSNFECLSSKGKELILGGNFHFPSM